MHKEYAKYYAKGINPSKEEVVMVEIEISRDEYEKIFNGEVEEYYAEITDEFKENIRYSLSRLEKDVQYPWKEPTYQKYIPIKLEHIDEYLRKGNHFRIFNFAFKNLAFIEESTNIHMYNSIEGKCELTIGKGSKENGTDPNKEYYILRMVH